MILTQKIYYSLNKVLNLLSILNVLKIAEINYNSLLYQVLDSAIVTLCLEL